MAAPKRTKTQREADRAETARLDRRGYSTRQIAERLNISHVQVVYDLAIVRERYREVQQEHRRGKIEEKREQYREVRREAWEAWERSKEDRERRVAETLTDEQSAEGMTGRKGKGKVTKTKAVKQVEGRLPDNNYLVTVLRCLEAERELDGLNAPERHEHGGPGEFEGLDDADLDREIERLKRAVGPVPDREVPPPGADEPR